MSLVAYPQGIDFASWVFSLKNNIPGLLLPKSPVENEWVSWGFQLINLNPKLIIPLPNKMLYPGKNGWRMWAALSIPGLSLFKKE